MALETRIDVNYLKQDQVSLRDKLEIELDKARGFRDETRRFIAEEQGGSVRGEQRAARVVRVVSILGGVVGLVSTVIVIVNSFTGYP